MSEYIVRHRVFTGRKANARSMDLDSKLPNKFGIRESNRAQCTIRPYTIHESMSYAREHAHSPDELHEMREIRNRLDHALYTQDQLEAL